ncbi:hypothetical protein [Mucilaginibacter segetis]|uniref:Zinc-finger domain-containing protein n=1 Tax=Mucilaginibacter segetis TaxID=2793071 RepID=A0A934PS96_9SPHI|nr:hypothetical protein [Mucilaginibacter segetis]MBK0379864.1 hypothetical protein [Mucilaginibacter segetis]
MNELNKIRYNCKQATFLIEKKLLGKITLKESVELRIHLIGCDACKLYAKQSDKINRMMQRMFKTVAGKPVTMDEKFKIELQERITDKLNSD